jgi:hypothetical protein
MSDIKDEIPKVKEIKDIDWNPLIKMCEEHLVEISEGFADDDTDHYIYETALTAIYGNSVWDYINSKLV